MLVVPHKPELVEIVPKRCAAAALHRTPDDSVTFTTFPRETDNVQGAISCTSARRRTIPSESKKPAVRSASSPGVRIVTAIESLPIRISNGSSTVTSSVIHSHEPSTLRRTTLPAAIPESSVFDAFISGFISLPPREHGCLYSP